jgi:hypothetical protein
MVSCNSRHGFPELPSEIIYHTMLEHGFIENGPAYMLIYHYSVGLVGSQSQRLHPAPKLSTAQAKLHRGVNSNVSV